VLDAPVEESSDVLQEYVLRSNVTDDPDDGRPEPALIGGLPEGASLTPGLTGEAGSDAIHLSTPWSAVESLHICPDRCWIQGFFFHPLNQDFAGIGFPLDVANAARLWIRQLDSEIEGSDSGAEGQNSEGT